MVHCKRYGNLFVKVPDVISSCKDLRTGCIAIFDALHYSSQDVYISYNTSKGVHGNDEPQASLINCICIIISGQICMA